MFFIPSWVLTEGAKSSDEIGATTKCRTGLKVASLSISATIMNCPSENSN